MAQNDSIGEGRKIFYRYREQCIVCGYALWLHSRGVRGDCPAPQSDAPGRWGEFKGVGTFMSTEEVLRQKQELGDD